MEYTTKIDIHGESVTPELWLRQYLNTSVKRAVQIFPKEFP